ncbi:hypothetical protein F4774DRAFT_401322 [Daldinia eschscholtzii]|nr:hypothetical protein F4774DRAFT_401322 [Daldinia eschscholtzii]
MLFRAAKKRLDRQGLENLLIRLEGGLSQDSFFCHNCTKSHRYSHSWAPGQLVKSHLEPPCKPDINSFESLYISFHHARLALNAHLFGPGRGTRLDQFRFTVSSIDNGWVTSSAARVAQDQLFLRISHRLVLDQSRSMNRHMLKMKYKHYVYRHITTHRKYRISGYGPNTLRSMDDPFKSFYYKETPVKLSTAGIHELTPESLELLCTSKLKSYISYNFSIRFYVKKLEELSINISLKPL